MLKKFLSLGSVQGSKHLFFLFRGKTAMRAAIFSEHLDDQEIYRACFGACVLGLQNTMCQAIIYKVYQGSNRSFGACLV